MNNKYELHKLQTAMDKDLFTELSRLGCFLAGGALVSLYNNNEINDWDIYTRNKESAYQLLSWLDNKKFKCMSMTRKSLVMAQNGGKTVNVVIFKYFNSLDEVFDTFDFTCCMGGFDFKKKEFEFHPEFFKDNLLKRLSYSRASLYPIGALLRVKKYIDKGFNISRTEMAKLAIHCTQLELNSIEEVEDQVNGMYGIELKEIYGDGEFDINTLLDKIENMDVHLETGEPKHVDNWNEHEIWDGIFHYTKIRNKYYKIVNNSILDETEKPKDNTIVNLFPMKLYKWVKKDKLTGELSSYWKNTFKYKVGEVIDSGNSHGLHCAVIETVSQLDYSSREDSVLIELEVHETDIINFSNHAGPATTIKKALVIREMPKEEIPHVSENKLFY